MKETPTRFSKASTNLSRSYKNLTDKPTEEKLQRRFRARFYEWSYAYAKAVGATPTMPGDDHAFFHSTLPAILDRSMLMMILGVKKRLVLPALPVKVLSIKTGLTGAILTNRLAEAMSVGLVASDEAQYSDGYRLLLKGKSFMTYILKPKHI